MFDFSETKISSLAEALDKVSVSEFVKMQDLWHPCGLASMEVSA